MRAKLDKSASMYTYVQVALKIAHSNGVLSYRLKKNGFKSLPIGVRVKVNVKNRLLTGVIIGEEKNIDSNIKFKDVLEIIDDQPIITKPQLDLMEFCARYYFNHLGQCIHLAVPKNEGVARTKKDAPVKSTSQIELTHEQAQAVDAILQHQSTAFLLEGVTGCGKTHVYIEAARAKLAQKQSVLFLVPEISLTPQLVQRVEAALGVDVCVMHSNITPAKKRDTIIRLLNGEPHVLIGARSAIFMPLKDLGLIVVDEEHDGSLKQDESPRYHARDLALWRGKNEGARVVLGSATPSLESVYNAQQKKLHHIILRNRFSTSGAMPTVTLIDLKKRASDVDHRTKDRSISDGHQMCILSRPLVEEMRAAIANKTQTLLFLNQRGYAKFGVCNGCGKIVECPNCSVSLTYYQRRNALMCHQCQHTEAAQVTCRHCMAPQIKYLGLGTERLHDEVVALFPKAKVVRIDRDVVRSQKRLEKTLSDMHESVADILIGTQMIAKGHDFQNVSLVGVVCADVALSMPDFRAAEKTFQLLTQVAGRAGRGRLSGKAYIQTFDPTHPSVHFAKSHNVAEFTKLELRNRAMFCQPPYFRAALIRCEHEDSGIAQKVIGLAHKILQENGCVKILGPAPSAIERVSNRYRFQCMITAENAGIIHNSLAKLKATNRLSQLITQTRARFILDVDPQNVS